VIAAWLALVALFGVLGALERIEGVPLGLFDLDGEGKPPAAFSGALLLCTGALSHLIGRTTRDDGRRGLVWNGMAAFFAYMAIDEMLTIHEHLEEWSGIGWTNLYLPLAAAGGVGWLLVLRRIWSLGRRLFEWGPRAFALGPAPWLVAIVLEKVQGGSRGRVDGYTAMATAEELLEMLGDGLFMVGLLFALRALAGYDSSSRTKA
jgi:hypothetical protein